MEERRAFVRLDTRLPIAYRVVPSTATKKSVTKDVGGSGVCLFLDEPLKPGTPLHVEIQLPEQAQPVTFEGEVVWCEEYEVIGKTHRERAVEAGLKVTQMHPRDRQALLNHVILGLKPHRPA